MQKQPQNDHHLTHILMEKLLQGCETMNELVHLYQIVYRSCVCKHGASTGKNDGQEKAEKLVLTSIRSAGVLDRVCLKDAK